MKKMSISRIVLGFAFSVLFSVGVYATTPVVYATCSQQPNNGGCKQADTEPQLEPIGPAGLQETLAHLDLVLDVLNAIY